MEERDVIVVGAGPVGLSVALGLARRQRDVLVLEKQPRTAEHSRAPAIWPATQEILAQLGVIDTFLEEGIVLSRLRLWDADRDRALISFPFEELADETPYPQLLILPQSRTERLLFEALQREGTAEVRFSSEVTEVDEETAGATVRYQRSGNEATVHGRFVAGCDGAHSVVRKQIDAQFDGETYKLHAALADVDVEAPDDFPFPRLTTRPHVAIGIRISARLWRLILPYPETDELALESRVEAAVDSLFGLSYRTVWQSEFRLHRRVSSQFQRGNVVLAGDAAHLNSPVGGQGMNAGIKDASLLIEALDNALTDRSLEPVEVYARARRQEVREGVNRFTDVLTRTLLFGGGRIIRPVFRTAHLAMYVPGLRRRFLRRLTMLD